MDFLWESITSWLKEVLVSGIISNLSSLFDTMNEQVGEIAAQVGTTPENWNSGIFQMVHSLSETVILPVAGVILAFVMTLELVQLLLDKNNFHEIESAVIFKWIFKTACAILIVSHTWDIVMGVFDLAQQVVNQAAGVIIGDTAIDITTVMENLEERLNEMDLGPLIGLWFQSLFVGLTMWALVICIFIIMYGRMIEIYLMASMAPVPMAAMLGREFGGYGTKLPAFPVCAWFSGIPHYGLRGYLCGAGTAYCAGRKYIHRHLDVYGLYGAAVLYPV